MDLLFIVDEVVNESEVNDIIVCVEEVVVGLFYGFNVKL